MDAYDSDDSLSDVGSGVSTNVLLGYATTDETGDSFSQLGGNPTWLYASQHCPPRLIKCKSCDAYMTLLLQINGDLPARFPGHERRLYIWACRKKACRRKDGSIRGVRAVRASKQATTQKKEADAAQSVDKSPLESSSGRQDVGSALFGAKPSATGTNANPFSTNSSSKAANPFSTAPAPTSSLAAKPPQRPSTDTEPVSSAQEGQLSETFAQKARISAPSPSSQPVSNVTVTAEEPWPTTTVLPKPFPSYYLDADYEYLSPTSPNANAASTSSNGNYAAFMDLDEANMDMDDEQPSSKSSSSKKASSSASSSSKQQKGSPSSSTAAAGDEDSTHDKTFLHFADTIAQNPEQVLRYEFGGSPLLYSRTDAVGRLFSQATAADNAKVNVSASVSGGASIPRCPRCGAARSFELQLTPHAIAELEAEEEAATLLNEGMEWGAVVFGVCSADCVPDVAVSEAGVDEGKVAYVEEWVGVQWEEVVDSRSGGGSSRRKK